VSAQKIDIDRVAEDLDALEGAFQKAFEQVVHEHAWRGQPIVGWRDGKVALIDANEYYRDGTVPLPAHLALPSAAPIHPTEVPATPAT
jgi:hypothetical protein